jgi:hypothetical protein
MHAHVLATHDPLPALEMHGVELLPPHVRGLHKHGLAASQGTVAVSAKLRGQGTDVLDRTGVILLLRVPWR